MSDESFEKGLQKRKKVLGEEYVQKNLDNADDFSLPFQKMLTINYFQFQRLQR